MLTTAKSEAMAKKRTDGAGPPTAAVKIDRVLASKARMIATDKGVTLADYLSDGVRAMVERDWAKLVRKTGPDPK